MSISDDFVMKRLLPHTLIRVAAEAAARGVHASPGTGLVDPETVAAFEKLDNTELAAELAGALAHVEELEGELEEQGETIAEALTEAGVHLYPEDEVSPPLDAPLLASMRIDIRRVVWGDRFGRGYTPDEVRRG